MRVLHIGKYLPPTPGGIETFLADLAGAQAQRGDQPHCLIHQRAAEPADAIEGVSIHPVRSYGQLLYTPIAPGLIYRVKQCITTVRPDLLHLHMPNPSAFAALMLPSARAIPWIVHWHSDVDTLASQRMLKMAYIIYRQLEQRLLRQSQAIIATSPDYLIASRALHNHCDKTHTVALGIDRTRLEPKTDAAAVPAWPQSTLKLLALGRMSHYKGLNYLINALAITPGCSLMIIGDGECRQALQEQIRRLDLGSRVTMPGKLPQSAVNQLLADCDVVCLTSVARAEAFGITLLEAMHFAKPVLASELTGSGMPWVVRQAGHGVLAKPGDAASISQCLNKLKDPSFRRQLGERGQQSLEHTFGIDRIASQIDAIYQRLMQPKMTE